ncbi:alpha/beta fold hydrolase [Ruegeria arenilitoris]|uniref:alpha/beta fold hydrolase n=1 Tax=Ruegeria arenilitoris TaxID=1173585 RepID=UPI00147D7FD1|nr:alpha/beta fold hydrolase [Ruegeria arenilitoris]
MDLDLDTKSRTAWISQGFERLAKRVADAPDADHFDVLIIGSGYGGAMAADMFAGQVNQQGKAISVAVLERGSEYLPGAFPTGLAELPRHVRREGNRQGLFDIRPSSEVITVLANGVGGGSLINAGVMERAKPSVFAEGWPAELADGSKLNDFYNDAAQKLGATIGGLPNTIAAHPDGLPQKHVALRRIAPEDSRFRAAAITVAMDDRVNSANVRLNRCVRCGDCATGCNFGAKDSLDVGLLARAHQKGAEIFSGATVLHVQKDGPNWVVHTVFTNATLRKREGRVTRIRARKVIIAAGTLGSNEIIHRSKIAGLPVSGMVGRRCSTNGDMLATDYDTRQVINNISNEGVKPSNRAIGPTITGVIDLRDQKGVLIEEISVPASLRVAFTQVFASVNALHGLERIDWRQHDRGFPQNDLHAAPDGKLLNTAVYAIMGDDGAQGTIDYNIADPGADQDGVAVMRWPTDHTAPIFDVGMHTLADLTEASGGHLMANPAWRLLPEDLGFLLNNQTGPVATVHPLGGLVMADTADMGAVNHMGQLFTGADDTTVHTGLAVLDGSIVPTAIGTNPALTIAALALRGAKALAKQWFAIDSEAPIPPGPPVKRPRFRQTDNARTPSPTKVEVVERLSGPVVLNLPGEAGKPCIVELTLRFKPKDVTALKPEGGDCILLIDTQQDDILARSRIRVFDREQWQELDRTWSAASIREQALDAIALYNAPLAGSLKVLERQRSGFVSRVARAGWAWLWNRGMRDVYQTMGATINNSSSGGGNLLSRIKSGIAIASRAGEIRALVYDLQIGKPLQGASISLPSGPIRGHKRFTYDRRCNPWRQLMEVTLDEFPAVTGATAPVLKLDLGYLARIGVPLFRITDMADGVTALSDVGAFMGYFVRLLLGIHIWSFRAPDTVPEDQKKDPIFRPPTELPTQSDPISAEEFVVPIAKERPDLATGDQVVPVPGCIHLTRYDGTKGNNPRNPVLMLHGYSAGGTTFAHHAVNPNLASHLADTGRDVWIADLRTSPFFGETTAPLPWSFDQIGRVDVPTAVQTILEKTGAAKIDVVAHCMGTIVFSIAVLSGTKVNGTPLNEAIERVAFTQVGPLVVFSPANLLRGYLMRYLIEFLPSTYSFNPKHPTLADDLLDRVLTTLPYPKEEFDIENPVTPWKTTPWTRTRHRMDALYGRDFSARNMDDEVLRHIDEHFGALNLRTVGTTRHFAKTAVMTDHHGRNRLVSRKNLDTYWKFDTFSLHGEENGLSDIATLDRMAGVMGDAGVKYHPPFINPKAGHQDSLIGKTRETAFAAIAKFLNDDPPKQKGVVGTRKSAFPPWIGPVLSEDGARRLVRLGAVPSHRAPEGVVMLRVTVKNESILRPDDPMLPWDAAYVENAISVFQSQNLKLLGWDIFALPEPEVLSGDPAQPVGNATLLLVVYDEMPGLSLGSEEGQYVRLRNGALERFDPDGGRVDDPPDAIEVEDFIKMGRATSQLLNLPGRILVSDEKPDRGYLYQRSTRGADVMTRDTREGQESQGRLFFGADAEVSEATLHNIEEQDYTLSDGIVPDRPDPAPQGQTRFSLASCQYPAGLLDGPVSYRSYGRLLDMLRGADAERPRFMLFVGDQVYVDPTAGLFDPADTDDRYRIPYENWLGEPRVRSCLRRVPSFMLLDDHEIIDNWEPSAYPDTPENQKLRNDGLAAFHKYQSGEHTNRSSVERFGLKRFEKDGFPFYLLNTRTNRTHRSVDKIGAAELVDHQLLDVLLDEIAAKPGPKFLATPSMFLPRHRRAVQRDRTTGTGNLSALHSDGWDGYPATQALVLRGIVEKGIEHLVLLSGDEHRGCFASGHIYDANGALVGRFHSIHTAGLSAPYPFANAIDEETLDQEIITFQSGGANFFCHVDTTRPPAGDGPTILSVRRDNGLWTLTCEFVLGSKHDIVL